MNFMKKVNAKKRSSCPINFAVEEFGDIWSLLIVRDILFWDKTTYGEFLSSQEKISTNILADRLNQLLEKGILNKTPHEADKRKDVYQLTQKGLDLYPIVLQMMLWSARYDPHTPISEDNAKMMKRGQEEVVKAGIKRFYKEYGKNST